MREFLKNVVVSNPLEPRGSQTLWDAPVGRRPFWDRTRWHQRRLIARSCLALDEEQGTTKRNLPLTFTEGLRPGNHQHQRGAE